MYHTALEHIWQQSQAVWPGFSVEWLPRVDSTNAELMRRVSSGHPAPVLLLAQEQTAGKGRLGRTWASGQGAQQGNSLTFSIGLPLAVEQWMGLSLVVGLSLAQSLHPAVGVKWPNDLWWQERKLAGVLIETTSLPVMSEGLYPQPGGQAPLGKPRWVVIGVGLNIRAPQAGVADARNRPAGVDEILGSAPDPADILTQLVLPLLQAVLRFAQQGFAPFQDAYGRRDVLQGQTVELSSGEHGLALGVDGQGAMQVRQTDGRVLSIHSADISVRPKMTE